MVPCWVRRERTLVQRRALGRSEPALEAAATAGFDGATTSRCIAAAVVLVVVEQAVQQTALRSTAASRSDFAAAGGSDFAAARRSNFATASGLAYRSNVATRIMVAAERAIEQAERAGVDRAARNKGNGQQDGGDYTTHREHLHLEKLGLQLTPQP